MTYRTHVNINDNTTAVGDNSVSGVVPNTVQEGDVMTVITVQNTSTLTETISGGGSGTWNLRIDASTISSNHRNYIWTKTAAANAAGSTITVTSSGGSRFIALLHVEYDVQEADLVLSGPTQDTTVDTAVDWSDVTVPAPDSHVVILGSHRSALGTPPDPGTPSGFTRRGYCNTNTAQPNYALMSATRNALGSGTVTVPDSTADQDTADQTYTIAFKPKAAVANESFQWQPSGVDGGGFQQAMAFSDPSQGHTAGLVIYAADVAGFHLSTDGGDTFRKSNVNLTELWHRKLVAIEFDRHNPNCVLAYFSNGTLTDATPAADVGKKAGILYGVIDVPNKKIIWTVLVDQQITSGPTYGAGLYPSAAEGANNTTARQTGKMVACDPFTPDRWYIGTRQGVVVATITRNGSGVATGATVTNLARNAATEPRDMVTSIVIGPESTSTNTVIYFTVREGGTNGGLNRREFCGPGQTGTGVLTRLAGTNSLTTAQGAEGCRAIVEAGVVVCYVWGGPRVRRWVRSSGATGTWEVIDPSGISADFRAHGGDAVRLAGDTATRVAIGHYSVDGSFPKIYTSENGGSSWNPVLKSKRTLNVGGTGEPWWLVVAKGYYDLSEQAGEGGQDVSQLCIRRDDPKVIITSGRSGGWRTKDVLGAGTNWHPSVVGLAVTVANYVAPHPTDYDKLVMVDVDWARFLSDDKLTGQPTLNESQIGSAGYQAAWLGNALVTCHGDRDTNNSGGVVYNSNPFGGGTWDNLSMGGGSRVWGVAIGTSDGSALTTSNRVVLGMVGGIGVHRKVGTNASALVSGTAAYAPDETPAGANDGLRYKCPMIWPGNGASVYAYVALDTTAGGIIRSNDRGLTWTKIVTFSTGSKYAGQLIADPSVPDRLYFVRRDAGSTTNAGVYRIDDADGTPTVTRILTLTSPGPIAIHPVSKALYAIALPDDAGGSRMLRCETPQTGSAPAWTTVASDFLAGATGFAHHMAFGGDGTAYIAHFDGGYSVGRPVSGSAPIANAGADQANIEPYTTVTLTGTDSDTDGTVVGRDWVQVGGTPNATLVGSGASRTFKAPGTIAGTTLTFQYRATDNQGLVGTDTMTVQILPVTERAVINGQVVPMEVRTA